jgi:membrane-bound lytic murein transglycosylase F
MRFLYALITVYVLVGCGFESEVDAGKASIDSIPPIPTEVENSGTLVALVDNSISSYYVYKGQPRGFEYELLQWFCEDHDFNLELRVVHFEHIIDSLLAGVGDIAAANLTVTRQRSELIHFSPYLIRNRQVLLQRQPKNYHRLSKRERDTMMVVDALDLDGKVVHVHPESSFYQRLQNFSQENGIRILIHPVSEQIQPDQLAQMVSEGNINFTIMDENTARLQTRMFPNVNADVPLSLRQSISWATRKQSDTLNALVENWIEKNRNSNKFAVIYRKYFRPTRSTVDGMLSPFNLAVGGVISPYDEVFKRYATANKIDWRFAAAVAYQESKFNPHAESPFGARGLMQLIPATAKRFGASLEMINVPEYNIMAGTAFLRHLFNYWTEKLPDTVDVRPFVLASYNAGLGHVIDARNLAAKHGYNDLVWSNHVEQMMLKKSTRQYYTDPVVKHGFVRGQEPVNYVRKVLSYYRHYQMLSPEDVVDTDLASAQ